jgi:hypothetical protein
MLSPGKDEEEKAIVDEDDYTSAFFDDDQLKQLKGGTFSQNDVDMLSQQTLSNFMAKGNFNDGGQ